MVFPYPLLQPDHKIMTSRAGLELPLSAIHAVSSARDPCKATLVVRRDGHYQGFALEYPSAFSIEQLFYYHKYTQNIPVSYEFDVTTGELL
jgi:hypothetical protein